MSEIRDYYVHVSDKVLSGNTLGSAQKVSNTDFLDLFKESINSVNNLQKTSGDLMTKFEMGDPDVNLAEVMIAKEKAKVGFEAVLQVRNKLIDAYHDVMNMPV